MSISLTATNQADGTGATISVTNDGGLANLLVSRFTGSTAERAFTNIGSIGSGNFDFQTAEMGPYIATAVNAANEFATPIFFRCSDGALPYHWQIMEAIREFVMNLALPTVSVDGDDHRLVKLPYRADMELDLVEGRNTCAFYFPVPESYTDATNSSDTVQYAVQLLLVRQIGQRLYEGMDHMLNIRQKIAQSFHRCPLADVPEVHTVNVVPGAVYLPEHWVRKHDCSTIVFRCETEQPAGIF
ncbi:MAG: hypothetical protein NXI32_22915 [bacterium]|nr:hypothetical protein [bacterium]